jgi:hypothetical protein
MAVSEGRGFSINAHLAADIHVCSTALLMSTGLTMGTISPVFGLTAGLIDRTRFSVLLATVALSAIVPTCIAPKWFQPKYELPAMNGAPSASENFEKKLKNNRPWSVKKPGTRGSK